MSFFFLVALVIGGVGSHWGPLVGAIVLTIIDQVLAAFSEYRFFLYGGTLLTVIVLMPRGTLGFIEMKVRGFLARRAEAETEKGQFHPIEIEKIVSIQDKKVQMRQS